MAFRCETPSGLSRDRRAVRSPVDRTRSQKRCRSDCSFGGPDRRGDRRGAGHRGGISRRLAAAGAHVVLADIDTAAAARDSIVGAGGACTVVVGDIRDRDVVAAVTETVLAVDDSRVDILVNNVGDFRPAAKTFLHGTEEQWQTLYELNLLHVLRMCHALLPAMVSRGHAGVPRHSMRMPRRMRHSMRVSSRSPAAWPSPSRNTASGSTRSRPTWLTRRRHRRN